MEAVFARGDRRTCDVLIKAFEKGAKFDGWSEYFNMDIWNEAMDECNLDADFYVIEIEVMKKYFHGIS